MTLPLSPKQLEFIRFSTKKWNLAHGSVRSGKTVGTVFRFMQAANDCPDNKIYIVGHTFDTAHRNVVRLILESPELAIFRPFCSWSGKKLYFKDRVITVLGAKDEGAIGNFQGDTYSLVYCDEMTLYPESIIDMIDTRLSKPYSLGFAAMNPSNPSHKIKQWIDMAVDGDPNYYQLHFTLEDNPFLDDDYKNRIKNSLSGVFYKRNYLGLWCTAEGAIFDFFDKSVYVCKRAPAAAEYYIASIDYGAHNPFCCLVIGVSTGKYTQQGKQLWVEAEYYWNHSKEEKTKVNSELAEDVQNFLEPYGVNHIYLDPSAEAFQQELHRRRMHVIHANNDVFNGINTLVSEMKRGCVLIMHTCKNLIREIEGYVWDTKAALKGEDRPIKKDDHAIDALRYAIASHKVETYNPYKGNHNPDEYRQGRFNPGPRRF